MKKLLALMLAILVPVMVFGQDAAQAVFANFLAGNTVAQPVTAVSTDVWMVVKYIGSDPLAKVAVAAGGDITFTDGADGDQVDTSLECPVSGGLGGIIDVSDTACDTMGEVVDIINASADWRAVLVDSLRSDSSNNTLITLAASSSVMAPEGLGLLNDGTVSFSTTRALTDKRTMLSYLGGGNTLVVNPFRGERSAVFQFSATSTYGSGTSTLQIIAVKPNIAGGSEVATVLWQEAGGATTVIKTLNFQPFGMFGQKDAKLLVRISNSAAMTAATANAYGVEYQYNR